MDLSGRWPCWKSEAFSDVVVSIRHSSWERIDRNDLLALMPGFYFPTNVLHDSRMRRQMITVCAYSSKWALPWKLMRIPQLWVSADLHSWQDINKPLQSLFSEKLISETLERSHERRYFAFISLQHTFVSITVQSYWRRRFGLKISTDEREISPNFAYTYIKCYVNTEYGLV